MAGLAAVSCFAIVSAMPLNNCAAPTVLLPVHGFGEVLLRVQLPGTLSLFVKAVYAVAMGS